MLKAHRIHTRISSDGRLTLENLPFEAGAEVEIIVLAAEPRHRDASAYSLRGRPIQYLDPTGILEPRPDDASQREAEREPGSAKGLFVVPDDFDALLGDVSE